MIEKRAGAKGAQGIEGLKGYTQTSLFTCGPAVLLSAMALRDPSHAPDQAEEYQIWREANTIYMGEGHPGCGVYGLALSALCRGFDPVIWTDRETGLFADTVPQSHAHVLSLMDERDSEAAYQAGIDVGIRAFNTQELRQALTDGTAAHGCALVLMMEDDGTDFHWTLLLAPSSPQAPFAFFDPWKNDAFHEMTEPALEERIRPQGRQAVIFL